jgi:glutathione S-transferase
MLRIYDHPLSPYAQKVKIALIEKQVPFETVLPGAIGSGAAAGEFVTANPRGEVPALAHDGVYVFDSTIILEYIEDCWPTPAMLPGTAADRARVRMIEEAMDTHYEAINWGLAEIAFFGRATGDDAVAMNQRAADQIGRWHIWLEHQLGARDWFNGETFGWGDLSVIPLVNGSAGFGLLPAEGSSLSRWMERANQRPSVARVRQEAAALSMGGNKDAMAGVRAAVEQGLFKREYRDHRLEWMVKSGGIEVVMAGLSKGNIRFTDEFGVTSH